MRADPRAVPGVQCRPLNSFITNKRLALPGKMVKHEPAALEPHPGVGTPDRAARFIEL